MGYALEKYPAVIGEKAIVLGGRRRLIFRDTERNRNHLMPPLGQLPGDAHFFGGYSWQPSLLQ